MIWRIRHRTEKDRNGRPKYWSQEYGWTWIEMADIWTPKQKEAGQLPFGMPPEGVWEEQEE